MQNSDTVFRFWIAASTFCILHSALLACASAPTRRPASQADPLSQLRANIAAATAKGNGLIEPVSIAINALIEGGQYDEVLETWGLESERIEKSAHLPLGKRWYTEAEWRALRADGEPRG